MAHIFVETNWLVDYAAPAHRQAPAAVQLLERASAGEFQLHIPNVCLGEARDVILSKYQPRNETDAIRRFVAWAQAHERATSDEAATTRSMLDRYENNVKRELGTLDAKLHTLTQLSYVDVFALNDVMLQFTTKLIVDGIRLKPFDLAILAGVLVRSTDLWNSGERELSFCETDSDLHPWDKHGNPKRLRDWYDSAHLWVYNDFTLTTPRRRPDFE